MVTVKQKQCVGQYLLKQIHGGSGVLMKQIIEDQEEASQDERHRAQLGIHADTQLLDDLDKQGQDSPPAFLRKVVENEEKQL